MTAPPPYPRAQQQEPARTHARAKPAAEPFEAKETEAIGQMTPTGGPATWLFSVRFCIRGGGGFCTTCRRRMREICFLPLFPSRRASGDQSGRVVRGKKQEVAPQAGEKMRSYVAVSSSCCLLYLLLQRGSQQGGRARGVTAAVAALPFLLSCASDLPRCLVSQSMWPLPWLEVDLRAMCGRRAPFGR
jgi:hypothetical protein